MWHVQMDYTDRRKELNSNRIMLALNGIDGWIKSNVRLPNTLFGVKDGISKVLMGDGPALLSFTDGSTLEVNTVAEVMEHYNEDLIDITYQGVTTVVDNFTTITNEVPPNVISLSIIGTLLMYNTLDNSLDRSIYFRGNGYTQEIYPVMLEDVRNIEELLSIQLVDILDTYSNHTTNVDKDAINNYLRSHSNYNMLRAHIHTVMEEIRSTNIGIDAPDTMWELMIEEGKLYIVYMGNPQMYRLYESQLSLERVEEDEVNKNPNVCGLPFA